jgi:hypothetical protein
MLLGPGTYNPQIEITKERSPSALIIGGSERSPVGVPDGVPGPGSYIDLNAFGADSIKISMHGKPRDPSNSFQPGPGYYDPSLAPV